MKIPLRVKKKEEKISIITALIKERKFRPTLGDLAKVDLFPVSVSNQSSACFVQHCYILLKSQVSQ